MSGPPVVDYTATSHRPGWDTLPAALQHALAVALGTEITEAGHPVGSGFTGGFAAPVTLADGRELFVKAAPDTLHAYGAYRREAEIVPQLPDAIRVPQIVATATTETDKTKWFAVASERIDGRMPGSPWTADDFAAVTTACELMADALTPTPLADLDALVDDLASGGWPVDLPDQLHTGDRPLPPGFQPWLPDVLQELSDLIALYPEALAGDTAMHSDLRPDNLLIDEAGTCWTVDWNWLSLGPKWFDWFCLLPIAQYEGIDTQAAISSSPLTADVPADHLDCGAAVVAAYMLDNLDAPPPPGCTPELRRHQRLYAWTFLDWLALRRGWSS
ncbi:phosphotransferase family protein [Kribbella lupini]|uniref:Aminoglycoside phosphotransferase domain-containing protein n=1 Tax=Kribbella lupini TaxID=291602 RepID=A0ABN2ABA0_9ACTN